MLTAIGFLMAFGVSGAYGAVSSNTFVCGSPGDTANAPAHYPIVSFNVNGTTGSLLLSSAENPTVLINPNNMRLTQTICTHVGGGDFYSPSVCTKEKDAHYTESRGIVSANAGQVVLKTVITPDTTADARLLELKSGPNVAQITCHSNIATEDGGLFILNGTVVWGKTFDDVLGFNVVDLRNGVVKPQIQVAKLADYHVNQISAIDVATLSSQNEGRTLQSEEVHGATCYPLPSSMDIGASNPTVPSTLSIDGQAASLDGEDYLVKGTQLIGHRTLSIRFINARLFFVDDYEICQRN